MTIPGKKDIIEIGYSIFALEGPEHLDEKVAEEVKIKRSELQDRFGVHDDIVEQLLAYHIEIIDDFLEDLRKCKTWDPDFINLIVDYKIPILFNRQLKLHSSDPVFNLAYHRISYLIRTEALDKWGKYTGLSKHVALSAELLEVIRDMFHSRITPENLNYEYLKALSVEFKSIIARLIKLEENVLKGN